MARGVNRDPAFSHNFELVAADDDGGTFVEADAKQRWAFVDDGDEVRFAVAGDEVLVDRGIGEEAHALNVIWRDHDGIAGNRAAHHEGPDDGGSGGTASDDTAAVEERVEFTLGAGSQIGVGEPPLASSIEPDAAGFAQRFNEGFAIGGGAIARVEHGEVGGSRFPKGLERLVRIGIGIARGGDEHDGLILAARQREEAFPDFGPDLSAADNDERAFFRAVRGGEEGKREEQGHGHELAHWYRIAR